MMKKRTPERRQAYVSRRDALPFDLWRFNLLWIIVIACFSVLVLRAFYIQIIDSEFLQKRANASIVRTETKKAIRGMVTDRNGVPLAISTPVMNVVIDPQDYFEAKKTQDALLAKIKADPDNKSLKNKLSSKKFNLNALADAIGVDRAEMSKKIYSKAKSRYVVLKKEVPPPTAATLMKRRFQGVYTEKYFKRYYPQPQPHSQIIGLTNSEGLGIEGLEMAWNKRLAGVDGQQRVVRDRRGNRIKVSDIVEEGEPGENIRLSIDSRLQSIMYRELASAGQHYHAQSATALAVDVKTGEILAMTSWPSYNPNDLKDLRNKEAMRNRAAIDMFEPGSTVKPLTIIAALESGKYKLNSVVNTAPGSLRIGNHTIRDGHNYGALSLSRIVIKSSNVGVAKIALSLPYSTLPTFYKRVGFGRKSAVQFPGESAGLILPPKKWNVTEVATMAYGYGLNTTVLQLASAYATIADGGRSKPLSLVKLKGMPKYEQLVDEKIANQVFKMMEGVVKPGGTAVQAAVQGYRVAGKTGTARKLRQDGRGYSTSEYRALFSGVAPVSNPKLALVVVVENPKGQIFGGQVAAPIFAKIMKESLRLLNVPLDKPMGES